MVYRYTKNSCKVMIEQHKQQSVFFFRGVHFFHLWENRVNVPPELSRISRSPFGLHLVSISGFDFGRKGRRYSSGPAVPSAAKGGSHPKALHVEVEDGVKNGDLAIGYPQSWMVFVAKFGARL